MSIFKPKGWDELFEEAANRWEKPNAYAYLLVDGLKERFRGTVRVLDAGYGAGRHLVYLHKQGFVVSGFEIASNAEKFARKKISPLENSDTISLKTFDMHQTPWPYKSESFEGLLAINVVHHTNYAGFLAIVDEMARVLVPGGLLLATVASKHNHKYGVGEQIDDHTYLTDSGAEKGIPHAFFDENDLRKIFSSKYNILNLQEISGEIPEADQHLKKEGALDHWRIYVEKAHSMD